MSTTDSAADQKAVEAIQAICRQQEVDASFKIESIHDSRALGFEEDRVCAAASVYKVAILLEYACQAAEGALDPTTRVDLQADERTIGSSGISVMLDPISLSIRDLAFMMIHVSDNTATDVLQGIVGTESIARRLESLGLTATSFPLNVEELLLLEPRANGITSPTPTGEEFDRTFIDSPSYHAKRGNVTTATDMCKLLGLVWRDEAGPAEACAEVRRIMQLQHELHRLSTAYKDGPVLYGKTGTLYAGLKNEIGVFEFGPGEAYSVSIFVRQWGVDLRDSDADRAIGLIARAGIDYLRGRDRQAAAA